MSLRVHGRDDVFRLDDREEVGSFIYVYIRDLCHLSPMDLTSCVRLTSVPWSHFCPVNHFIYLTSGSWWGRDGDGRFVGLLIVGQK